MQNKSIICNSPCNSARSVSMTPIAKPILHRCNNSENKERKNSIKETCHVNYRKFYSDYANWRRNSFNRTLSYSNNLRSSTKPLIDKFYEHVPPPILTNGKCNYVDNVYFSNKTQRIKAIDIDEDGDKLDFDLFNINNNAMLKSPPSKVIKPKNRFFTELIENNEP